MDFAYVAAGFDDAASASEYAVRIGCKTLIFPLISSKYFPIALAGIGDQSHSQRARHDSPDSSLDAHPLYLHPIPSPQDCGIQAFFQRLSIHSRKHPLPRCTYALHLDSS